MATEIPGWVHPLSVDPDDRPAITAANLQAIARHKERVATAVALFGANGDQEDQA